MNGEINEILKKIENNELSDSEGMKQLEVLRERFEKLSPKEENGTEPVSEEFGESGNLHFRFVHNEILLKDHLIFGEQVLMGVAHLSMAVEYIRKNYSNNACLIKNALFSSALMLEEKEIGKLRIQEASRSETAVNIESLSQKNEDSDYEKNAGLQLQLKKRNVKFTALDVHSFKENALKVIDPSIFYRHPDQACYGASLFSVKKVYEIAEGEVFGQITITSEMQEEYDKFYFNPALLDACHVTSTLALKGDSVKNHWVPLLIKEIYVDLNLDSNKFVDSYCYVKHKISNSQISEFDMQICDPNGNVYLVLNGFTTKHVPGKAALFGGASQPVKAAVSQPAPRPVMNVSATGGNLQSVIQGFIQSIIASQLNLDKDQVPLDKNFMEMGLDSNSMMETVTSIEDIGVELYATLFFEYQNINELVEYLMDEHEEKFADYFGQPQTSPADFSTDVSVANEELPGSTGERQTTPKPSQTLSTPKKSFPHEEAGHHDIAVIGMHGYLPQSHNLDEFWQHIEASKDLVTEIPQSRFDYRPWFDKNPEAGNKTYSKWGGFIHDLDKFDPTFFEISPKFAEWMDPQLRLLLQSAYKTFEDAGLINQIRGSNTSVYVGSCFHEYWDEIVRAQTPIVDYQYWSQVMSSLSGTVSYTFDLQGASIPLDNACASSLTALHLGAEAISNGECDMSFVAGLNVILSPLHYVHFSKLHALSPNGRCYTFEEKADGYVPGEGVVSVLLKRLDRAVREGDNIHAIIKGTAINHTGRSNNPTSPRPELQTKMLLSAWEKAQIDPEDISYIDAHGTGTKLGDPIEINALKRAFKKYTNKTNFCTIGSTKAHLGHLEGAAGLASVIKVILMMKNKKIPKMPNFEKQNPLIQLNKSPFNINTELLDWKSEEGKNLLAGVSSFGITGNNAHAVVEEYITGETQDPNESIVVNSSSPVMIPLSAKKQDRLKEHAENLFRFVQKNSETNSRGGGPSSWINLVELAYTLQVGREEMEERLGLIVNSIEELEEKLQSFVEGKRNVSNLYLGNVKQNKEILSIFTGDEDHQKALETWMVKGKYNKLLNLWVKGFTFDWNKLYGENKPRRMSAPTYPFAKDSYWVENLGLPPIDLTKPGIKNHLHPLVQENTSVLSEQRFSSTFTGDESFLRDHKIKGDKVLPGVTYLEMANEAVVQATRNDRGDNQNNANIKLKNVVWAKPIIVDTPLEVHIGLYPQEMNGKSNPIIDFEVYTDNPNSTKGRIMHCQGMATLAPLEEIQPLNLGSIRKKFEQSSLSSQRCYDFFETMGFDFGPAHKGIVEVFVRNNEETVPEVFAQIELPSSVLDTQNQYTLHPSILDASLQALIVGLNIGRQQTQPMLPFVLESIEIVDKCPNSIWVWARLVRQGGNSQSGSGSVSGNVQKFDVDLCDDSGKICVKMKGFTSRVLKGDVSADKSSEKDETNDVLTVKPVWQEKIEGDPLSDPDQIPEYMDHQVFFCGLKYKISKLRKAFRQSSSSNVTFNTLKSRHKSLEQCFENYSLELLKNLQKVNQDMAKGDVLIQVVVPAQGPEQLFSALSGLLKTACLENSKIIGQVIAVSEKDSEEEIIFKLRDNSKYPEDRQIRYEGNTRLVSFFEEIPNLEKEQYIPWKEGGIYLITGGTEGLGMVFAREIAEQVKDAVLVLSGPTKLNKEQKESLRQLENLRVKVEYKSIDISDQKALKALVQEIQTDIGEINGIVHSTGATQDNLILKKNTTEFKQVLTPNKGVMNLDQAAKDLSRLDFFVLLSSGSGPSENLGQADYSVANAFMGAFAKYRNSLLDSKARSGHTLSINWPLWKESGMKTGEEAGKMLQESKGKNAMEPSLAIESFYHSLASLEPLVMILTGALTRMNEKQLSSPRNISVIKVTHARKGRKEQRDGNRVSTVETETNYLLEKIKKILTENASNLLKLGIEDIDVNEELSVYGFDSIMLTGFTNQINRTYQLDLTPTVFFEYPTIASLANYLADKHAAVFSEQPPVMEKELNIVV